MIDEVGLDSATQITIYIYIAVFTNLEASYYNDHNIHLVSLKFIYRTIEIFYSMNKY